MWVDKIMHKAVFEDLVQKMNDEWQQFVLFVSPFSSGFPGFFLK